ncbi:hypothetical protein SteCoe_22538 [Stentor coeruleus]|uniref:Uncharacterized protein n=1 Tax=Stentor coeruleus TaxID=5963 RepID=A0A1R2BM34_9CILI|nr:hypothetical protein SteCoe_22538 [Stentor coeruleus]
MGCSNTRESTRISDLKNECNKLMQENLNSLTVIEYLLLQSNRQSLALRMISLKKRTEEYYEIVTKYRNLWISKAKKDYDTSSDQRKPLECEKEQCNEKQELLHTKNTLHKTLDYLHKNWSENYSTMEEFKESIEKNIDILQKSTSLYGSYYIESKDVIKGEGKLEDADQFLYKSIKSVTVNLYKIPEKRVYYSPDIEFVKRPKGKLAKISNEDIICELKSFEDAYKLIPIAENEESNEIPNIDLESVSEKSYTSNDLSEDEETIRERLSYTQK